MTTLGLFLIGSAGALFTLGLAIAGVTSPHVVLDALRFDDARLWLMFAGAQLVSWPATRWLVRRGQTLVGRRVPVLPVRAIDRRLVVGSLVFGAGWGLSGICPGRAFATGATGSSSAGLVFVGLWIGIACHDLLQGA